ncbi:MAG: hypothetical protein AB1758_18790 [Candidatus Eremiobacterota bacterium]
MKPLLIALMLLGLCLPARAEAPTVVLDFTLSTSVPVDGRLSEKAVRPKIATRDRTTAKIEVGGKDDFVYAVQATPEVRADGKLRVRMELDAAQSGSRLRQIFTLTLIPGEASELTLEDPGRKTRLTLSVTGWVVPPGKKLEGFDAQGRPIIR